MLNRYFNHDRSDVNRLTKDFKDGEEIKNKSSSGSVGVTSCRIRLIIVH